VIKFKGYFFCHVDLYLSDTPRYPGMQSELDCWMEWIENQMAEETHELPVDDEMEDFIGGTLQFFFMPLSVCVDVHTSGPVFIKHLKSNVYITLNANGSF